MHQGVKFIQKIPYITVSLQIVTKPKHHTHSHCKWCISAANYSSLYKSPISLVTAVTSPTTAGLATTVIATMWNAPPQPQLAARGKWPAGAGDDRHNVALHRRHWEIKTNLKLNTQSLPMLPQYKKCMIINTEFFWIWHTLLKVMIMVVTKFKAIVLSRSQNNPWCRPSSEIAIFNPCMCRRLVRDR